MYDTASVAEDKDDAPTGLSRLFRRGFGVPSSSSDTGPSQPALPSDPSDGALGLGRMFRIGFPGRGRGGGPGV